jgi:hypothetical protein
MKNTNINGFNSISSYGNEEFKKFLKQGKIHLGINQKQEQVYLDLKDMTNTILGATTGGGKSVLLQLMTHSAVFQLNTKTISSIDIIDPKSTEMEHYKGLDKNLNVYNNYEEIPNFFLSLEVELKARRKYLLDNKLRKFFENYKVIIFNDFEQMNKLKEKQGQEISDYCYKILKETLQLGKSFGVKSILSTRDLTAETIPTTFKNLFEDTIIGKTLESYHASVLVNNEILESFELENTKSLTTGQFILNSNTNYQNDFIQSYFSETNPNSNLKPKNYKEVYEKGKKELEQDEEFENILKKYKMEVLLEMLMDKNLEEFKKDLIIEQLRKELTNESKTI